MASPTTVAGNALKTAGIIPDLLPESLVSSEFQFLPVKFVGSADQAVEVKLGNEITATTTHNDLQIQLPTSLTSSGESSSSSSSLYTVICLDADAPSRRKPRFRSFLHFMQVNVPQSTVGILSSSTGSVVADWYPAGPPQTGGLHRYVFFLYKQSSLIFTNKLPKYGMMNRGSQTIDGLTKVLNAAGSGPLELVAVNWFEAQWDQHVNEWMKKQLGWMGFMITPMMWLTNKLT